MYERYHSLLLILMIFFLFIITDSTMVRNYIRKTDKGRVPGEILKRAYELIESTNKSVRSAAEQFNIPRSTLRDYIKRCKDGNESSGYSKPHLVFNAQQEHEFVQYLQHASSIYFGLTPIECRRLAYNCAEKNGISYPNSWKISKLAGRDWFTAFMKRNPELSIRTPESTSIARASAFNEINVNNFFTKLGTVYDRVGIVPARIYNIDETGITTVTKPPKVIAKTGIKQIGSLVSAERGELVTLCAAISACGQALPPFFVFPRVNYKEYFLRGAPTGSSGSAYRSGWMTEDNFVLFLEHFKKFANPSPENPVLVVLDNHDSHVNYRVLEYAKKMELF